MPAEAEVEYDDKFVALLETVWGEGFLSPGGPDEVALILEASDIRGKHVLDIGCGVGGIDVLLVREHGAAHVTGIDVEAPVLAHARDRARREKLTASLTFRRVDPGPLPFSDASFDVVFSKDAMIHIPDKQDLFAEVQRVLKPGGIFTASDWMRCDDRPASAQMRHYIESEGLSFDMAPPRAYADMLAAAGFTTVALRDRNDWYRRQAGKEYEAIKGPLYERLVSSVGKELTDRNVEVWRALCVVLDSGELRPGHIRAVKPS